MTSRRATIAFEPDLHRALRLKAATMKKSISAIVNDAVRETLAEDAADLEAFEARHNEPRLDFAAVVRKLKRRGRL